MRIAYVHTANWPSNSPSVTFSSLTAFALAQIAQKCYFYVKKDEAYTADQVYKKYFKLDIPSTLEIPQLKPLFKFSNKFYYNKVYNDLVKNIKKGKLDVVISRKVSFLPYLAKLKSKYGVQVYYEVHDFYSDAGRRKELKSNKQNNAALERTYFKQLSGVICLHKTQAETIKKHYPEMKIVITGTGIQKIHHLNDHREFITYIGSFDRHKGLSTLLEASKYFSEPYKVLFIGAKNEVEVKKLKELTSDNSNIKILSWLKPTELGEYLAKTRIGILPLQDTFFNSRLTSPLKLFDYFGYGIPVISADIAALRDLVSENKTGLFFENNPKDLAHKIDRLMSDEMLWQNMSKNVYAFAEQKLWTNRAQQLIAHFQNQAGKK